MAATRLTEFIGLQPANELELAQLTEQGISPDSVTVLKDRGLTCSEISEVIISARRLKHRKERKEPLSKEETDRVVRVARILALAEDVFRSRDKALMWLRVPDDRLTGRTPMKMLVTESGGR